MKYVVGLGVILSVLSFSIKAVDLSPEEIDALHNEAKQAFYAADYANALSKWEKALTHARQLNRLEDMSKFLVNLGVVNYSLGEYQKALRYYQEVLTLDRKRGDKSGESADLTQLGLVYYSLGEYQKALKHYHDALTIQTELKEKRGDILGNIGLVYNTLGEYQKSLDFHQQALGLHRNIVEQLDETADKQTELVAQQAVSNDLSNLGIVYDNLGQYKKALSFYKQALAIKKDIADQHGMAKVLSNMGTGYKHLSDYPKAQMYYNQALQIQSQIGDISGIANNLTNLGAVYDSLAQYRQALGAYQEALHLQRQMGDQRGIGSNLSNIGGLYKNRGYLKKALHYYQQALNIQRHMGDQRSEANTLTLLGALYNIQGQYAKALKHYLEALAMHRKVGEKKWVAHTLSNLGVLYYNLGQIENALGYFLQALTIRRELGDKQGEGVELSHLGLAYSTEGLHSKALKRYQAALQIKQELGDKRGEGTDLSLLGGLYATIGEYKKALTYFQQALVIDRALTDKMGESLDLANIGMMYQQLEQYEAARQALQDSIAQLKTLDSPHLWYAQSHLAAVEAKLHNNTIAIAHYEKALDHIEKLRAALIEKTHKLSFMQNKLFVYDKFITLLQNLHTQQPNQGYDRKALEIFERKQGRVFLEQLGQSGAERFAHLPTSLLQKEQRLQHQLSHTEAELLQARNQPFIEQDHQRLNRLIQQVNKLNAKQEALQAHITANYPAYSALKYPKPISTTTLQNEVLQPGEMMLIYGIMENSTALWVISPREFTMLTIPAGEEELAEDVAYMRDVILNRLPEIIDEGYPLYEKLIPEAARKQLAKADTVYIVPTGPLYQLPFETLVTNDFDYYNPHYLILDQAIAYLSSASVLKILRDTQRHVQPQKKLLAFADPTYASCDNDVDNRAGARARSVAQLRSKAYRQAMGAVCFPQLPETQSEAKAIAALFNPADNTLFLGKQASRGNVLQFNPKMSDYRYLLFAVHGLLPNEVKGLVQSSLVLSNVEDEAYLTMADAFTLQLNADFINLSACNTGGGKKIKGEGIMGLSRAFMYAGTRAIGVTLWSVESASAENLSVGIFTNLKAGKQAAEAMRQIKLKMIAGKANKRRYRHPFYWAPFVMYGMAQ
jgi:tetratricopeptide (TPR) repeat protein